MNVLNLIGSEADKLEVWVIFKKVFLQEFNAIEDAGEESELRVRFEIIFRDVAQLCVLKSQAKECWENYLKILWDVTNNSSVGEENSDILIVSAFGKWCCDINNFYIELRDVWEVSERASPIEFKVSVENVRVEAIDGDFCVVLLSCDERKRRY